MDGSSTITITSLQRGYITLFFNACMLIHTFSQLKNHRTSPHTKSTDNTINYQGGFVNLLAYLNPTTALKFRHHRYTLPKIDNCVILGHLN